MNKNDTQFDADRSLDHGKESDEITMSEHLSALLDDEAGSFEQRRVLDELKSNDGLSQSLSHFALIGESMRSTKPVAIAGSDFLAGIHAQIDAEPEYHNVALQAPANDQTVKQSSWLRPIGGFALAASVVAVAVIGFQNYQLQRSGNTDDLIVATSTDKSPTKQLSQARMDSAIVVSADKAKAANDVASISDYKPADARTRSLLKRFVDKHIRYAPTSSFVPSVRVIAYADYK